MKNAEIYLAVIVVVIVGSLSGLTWHKKQKEIKNDLFRYSPHVITYDEYMNKKESDLVNQLYFQKVKNKFDIQ
jgi:hypothetical protein